MNPFGFTRSSIHSTHAFITPESHVEAPLPNWTKTMGIILISPQMQTSIGPCFTQYLALMESGGTAAKALPQVERFVYVLEGEVVINEKDQRQQMTAGGYAYIPPNLDYQLSALTSCRLVIFERHYISLDDLAPPDLLLGRTDAVEAAPFMGDPDAQLKTLLPPDLAFDMAVNLFTFTPGAALPLVEVHVMEHGLLLLEGQGIYRLAEQWYPIQAGDVIWMAPYCPQWFAAIGKSVACYLYYKDINRDPLEGLI